MSAMKPVRLLALTVAASALVTASAAGAITAISTPGLVDFAQGPGGEVLLLGRSADGARTTVLSETGAVLRSFPRPADTTSVVGDTAGGLFVGTPAGVRHYDRTGALIGSGPVTRIDQLAVSPLGEIYVYDMPACTISRLGSDLAPAQTWGSCGTGPGQIGPGPAGGTVTRTVVSIGAGDVVFVADFSGRLQRFSRVGALLGETPLAGEIFAADPQRPVAYFAPTSGGAIVGTPAISRVSAAGTVLGSLFVNVSNSTSRTEPFGANAFVGALAVDAAGALYARARSVFRIDPTPIVSLAARGVEHDASGDRPASDVVSSESVRLSAESLQAVGGRWAIAPGAWQPFGEPVTRYDWDTDGDGQFDRIGAGPEVGTSFSKAGEYRVQVRATSTDGLATVATAVVRVRSNTPTAALGVRSVVVSGSRVPLDASGSKVPVGGLRFAWDLDGDGRFERDSGSTATAIARLFRVGRTAVSVRVTSRDGNTATARRVIDVRPAPPSGTVGVSINRGARVTDSRRVSLALVWPRLATHARISNDGGFATSRVVRLSRRVRWTLGDGPSGSQATVYVRYIGSGVSFARTHSDEITVVGGRAS